LEHLSIKQESPNFSKEESVEEEEEDDIEVPKCDVCLDILETCSNNLVTTHCDNLLGRSLERSLMAYTERTHCPVCREPTTKES